MKNKFVKQLSIILLGVSALAMPAHAGIWDTVQSWWNGPAKQEDMKSKEENVAPKVAGGIVPIHMSADGKVFDVTDEEIKGTGGSLKKFPSGLALSKYSSFYTVVQIVEDDGKMVECFRVLGAVDEYRPVKCVDPTDGKVYFVTLYRTPSSGGYQVPMIYEIKAAPASDKTGL